MITIPIMFTTNVLDNSGDKTPICQSLPDVNEEIDQSSN